MKRYQGSFRLLMAAIFLLFASGLAGCGSRQGNAEALKEGLQYLSAEAEKDAQEINQKLKEKKASQEKEQSTEEKDSTPEDTQESTHLPPETPDHSEDTETEVPPPEESLLPSSETPPETAAPEDPYADLKNQVETLNITPFSEAELAKMRSLFDRTVFIGDSLTQAILTYGFFDENHIKYKRSASISDLGPEIEAALQMLPDNIVFFTGLNDVSRFITDPAQYYEAYKEKILGILNVRPDIHIYVISLLPPSNDLARVNLNLARSPEFDEQLKRAAGDTPAVYVDCHWMVRQQLYLDDGIHFKEPFYTILFKYLAGEMF